MIHIYLKVDPDIMNVRALSKTVKIEPTTIEYGQNEKQLEERIARFVTETIPILVNNKTFGKIYVIEGEAPIDNIHDQICKLIEANI